MSDEEITVTYDNTTGIPSNELQDGENYYAVKISPYFYTKLNSINNNNTFTNDEISEYGLDVSNGKINTSTTKKMVNYLVSLIKSNAKKLDTKIDETFVIDDELHQNSEHPVQNSVLYTKFNQITSALNGKSNIGHTHNINDVNSLNNTLTSLSNSKADITTLNNHINNKNNPHNVTPQQLGLSPTLTQVQQFSSDGVIVTVYANAFLVHVTVVGDATNIPNNATNGGSFNLSHSEGVPIGIGYRPPFTYATAPATTSVAMATITYDSNTGKGTHRNENYYGVSKITIDTSGNVYIINATENNYLKNIRTCLTYPKV